MLASVCVKNQAVPSPRRDGCASVLVRQLPQVLCRFSMAPVTPEFKKWQRVLTVAWEGKRAVKNWFLYFFSLPLLTAASSEGWVGLWGKQGTVPPLQRPQGDSGSTAQVPSFLWIRLSPKGELRKPGRRCPSREHNHRVMQLLPVPRVVEGRRESSLRSQGLDTPLQERRGASSLCHFLCRHHCWHRLLLGRMYACTWTSKLYWVYFSSLGESKALWVLHYMVQAFSECLLCLLNTGMCRAPFKVLETQQWPRPMVCALMELSF